MGEEAMSDFRKKLKRDSCGYFEHLEMPNGLTLSIQASRFHYCSPRQDDLSPMDYYQWEVAILDAAHKWIHPREHPALKSLGLDEHWRNDDVGGFISAENVQCIFDACQVLQ